MRQNIQRTEQRGATMADIEEQTFGMQKNAEQFRRGTNRVYKGLKMKNIRFWIYIILGLAVFALIIGLGSLSHEH